MWGFGGALLIGCGGNSTVPGPAVGETTPAGATAEQPADLTQETASADESTTATPKPLRPVPTTADSESDETRRARQAFTNLLAAAEKDDPEAWSAAEQELQALGAAIVPALIPALEGDAPLPREMAVMFLAQLGPEAAPAATALEALLTDPSPFVQVNVAALLTTFQARPLGLIDTLLTLLEHPDTNVRLTALSALGNCAEDASAAEAALRRALDDADPRIRQAAITTAGRWGPVAAALLPSLRQLAEAEDPETQAAALLAVRKIDPETAPGDTVTLPAGAEQP